MTRYMGIDYGSAKIGIAITDPLKIIAREYEVIFTKNVDDPVEYIANICKKENVELIVLGLPINMDGSIGFQAEICLDFKKLLEQKNLKVVMSDERLTTKMAEETMTMLQMSKEQIKVKSDAKAAAIILQNYIDYI